MLDALPQIFEASAAPLDFVDLVNEDDAPLSSVHVTFGSQDQPGQQALNVISNIAFAVPGTPYLIFRS